MITLNKKAIDYLLGCETVGEVRAFLRGVLIQGGSEIESKPMAPVAAPVVAPAPAAQDGPKYKLRNRGLQAKLLRIMYTGPVSQAELEDEMEVEPRDLDLALKRMKAAEMIVRKKAEGRKTPLWALTEAAVPKAKFFVDNPTMKIRYGVKA